ncbi:MAG: Asp-tRNA(Asn)/Glu-tRNA(Gln) amidotransferase subunit GatC [Patescibacteria group bacterium]
MNLIMSKVDKKNKTIIDVDHLAQLANLKLSQQEAETYQKQLNQVIGYIDQLKELNTDAVTPTPQTTEFQNLDRQDKVTGSLKVFEGLRTIVQQGKRYFHTKKIVWEN